MHNQSSRPVDCMEDFVKRHENKIYRIAIAIMGNKADAEDIMQDVFLKVLENKTPQFESVEHEIAWLTRVTVNHCRNRLRSHWWKKTGPLLDIYPAQDNEQQYLLETVNTLPPHKSASYTQRIFGRRVSMKKYVSYLDSISVDPEQHERTMERLNQRPLPSQKPRVIYRYAGLAACAAVIVLCVWTIPGLLNNTSIPNNPIVPPSSENPAVNNPAQTTPSNPVLSAENPNSTIKIAINEITEPTSGSMMFNLMSDDFIPMTYDEVTDYFAVTMPISDILPDLKLQPKSQDNPYGIYSSDNNGRGHYYDANQFLYVNENGSQSFSVTLEKVFFFFGYQLELENPDSLTFSNINGRKLAIFHYIGSDKHDCYHVEFVQNGVAYCVQSSNMSQDNFIKGLTALVEKTEEKTEPRTLIGTVNLVDTYTGHIGIEADVDQAYKYMGIHLPIGEAKDSLFQKRVAIFYEGEPATVNQIWSQQFISMNIIDE